MLLSREAGDWPVRYSDVVAALLGDGHLVGGRRHGPRGELFVSLSVPHRLQTAAGVSHRWCRHLLPTWQAQFANRLQIKLHFLFLAKIKFSLTYKCFFSKVFFAEILFRCNLVKYFLFVSILPQIQTKMFSILWSGTTYILYIDFIRIKMKAMQSLVVLLTEFIASFLHAKIFFSDYCIFLGRKWRTFLVWPSQLRYFYFISS